MEKIPIVICIDVEPEARAIDPNVAADWIGFEKTFEFFDALRPRLEDETGSAAHFSWFVRMDPQIAHTYRNAAWPVLRYRGLFDRMAASSDEVGLHIHAWRWDAGVDGWIADMGDQEWVDHCVRIGFAAFRESLNRPCQSFRFGDHWMNDATLELVESLGARFDLTAEPGRKALFITEPYTGLAPDYTRIPRQPYSRTDFAERSDSPSRQLWSVPLSTCDPDQLLSFITQNGNEHRLGSLLEPAKSRATRMTDDGYQGFLDRADHEVIGGWAYDARRPDEPLEIEILDGDVSLAKVTADGLRGDLLLAGKGNGRHSFGLPTPTCLRDGQLHSLSARVSNSRFELRQSPRAMKLDRSAGEPDANLLDLGGEPWLMSRIMAVLLGTLKQRYLAISLRSNEILDQRHVANMTENFANILGHQLVKDFAFQTPAELFASFEVTKHSCT